MRANAEMQDLRSISGSIELGGDGIWYGSGVQDVSYPTEGYAACFAVEDESFWFRHRNACIVSVVRNYPPTGNGAIFDVGGGNGFVALGLEKEGFNVVLVEPGKAGAVNAKHRGLKNVVCATTETAGFGQHSLPAVGLFDVIEHIEDDAAFLRSIRMLLRPEGRLYMTVPSYDFLWSAEDVGAGHFRRYTQKNLDRLLESAGFNVEFSSYIFRFLPVPIFFLRTLPYRMGISKSEDGEKIVARDHVVSGGVTQAILNFMLRPEIENLRNNKPMHVGASCIVVARCA